MARSICASIGLIVMNMFINVVQVYLYGLPVDFRKSINGLSLIVEQELELPLFSESLFLFCNRAQDKIKILYWDKTGFCLWYKRLEKDRFKWPNNRQTPVLDLTEEQLHWLLQGYDITQIKGHKTLNYQSVN